MSEREFLGAIELPLCHDADSSRIPVLLFGKGLAGNAYSEKMFGEDFDSETKHYMDVLKKFSQDNTISRGMDYATTDFYQIANKAVDTMQNSRTEKISISATRVIQILQFAWADADVDSEKSYLRSSRADVLDAKNRLDGPKFSTWWKQNRDKIPRELQQLKKLWDHGDANGILDLLKKGSKIPSLNAWMKNASKNSEIVSLLVINSLVRLPAGMLNSERKLINSQQQVSKESKRGGSKFETKSDLKNADITPTPEEELVEQFGGMSMNEQRAIAESFENQRREYAPAQGLSLL